MWHVGKSVRTVLQCDVNTQRYCTRSTFEPKVTLFTVKVSRTDLKLEKEIWIPDVAELNKISK